MKNIEIMMKTYDLVNIIKTSNAYLSYIDYENKILNDNELKKLLKIFQINKESFEEAYRLKEYYPNYSEIKNRYQQAKIELMNNNLFKQYKIYEKEIDLYIKEVESKLKEIVNIKDKHGSININIK